MTAFARYVVSKANDKAKETAYRVYVTDTLKMMLENTATVVSQSGGSGKFIEARYFDVINPKPKDERTEEEIINHIKIGVRGDSK